MSKLEELTEGCAVAGLASNETVRVVHVKRYGDDAVEVTYKTAAGTVANQLLFREDEARIEVKSDRLVWTFDANGDDVRLASEAYRINLAYLFDPFLAVHLSAIEPLPHQIAAVYQEMLPRLPLRYVLADDPGAGKTVMTGLYVKELIVRGDLKRCLIVSPGSLAEQWQDELYSKFNLKFTILTNDLVESSASGNVFSENNLLIARLDKLARNDKLHEKLKTTDWDLIVVDEAHKMSASRGGGGDIRRTKRFRLGQTLSEISRYFLLLTATPHNGVSDTFQLFMSLVDPDRFEPLLRNGAQAAPDVSDVMRRMVKEDLLKFDGSPLFPERFAHTVNYRLSDGEARLYDAVTDYVREEFNRADALENKRKCAVGFALTILQRRLASSPEAIYQSLARRLKRLETRLNEKTSDSDDDDYRNDVFATLDFDDEEYSASELESEEDLVAERASAARTIAELKKEILTLKELTRLADGVRRSGEDRKWEELSKLLCDDERMFSDDRLREKIVVFTEHLDTLRYLERRIGALLGNEDAVVVIHGGTSRDERRKNQEIFLQDQTARVLIATDAAGEGINLQRAHLMINYDLPWNPNRLEQRFGRIHRIGQTKVCHLWNLVAYETREGLVFTRLLTKLEEERKALGGKVFDILGAVSFDGKPLRELLIEAVRNGEKPDVRERIQETIDRSVNFDKLRKLIDENALTRDVLGAPNVGEIRDEMERMEARKLQPHFVEAFFLQAFKSLGGTIYSRERGRYEIKNVPAEIRDRDKQFGLGERVLQRYERVCFEKDRAQVPGMTPATLLCPGQPLLDAVAALVRERNAEALKRGAILVDDADDSTDPRLLFYVESTVLDASTLPNGRNRVVSKILRFVELKENGSADDAGFAPYLDYRSLTEEERGAAQDFARKQEWLTRDLEHCVIDFAVRTIVHKHAEDVKARREPELAKIAKAVDLRMGQAIRFYDRRAEELKRKEAKGKGDKGLNSANTKKRAEELRERLENRLNEIKVEGEIFATPPVVVGGALILPAGLMRAIMPNAEKRDSDPSARKAVELAGMKAVMELERRLGRVPKDVSAKKCGYDVESAIPQAIGDEPRLLFIEVKSRAKGAASINVSKNEILTALNRPNNFILAIVEVDGDATLTTYLKRPFKSAPDFSATGVAYDVKTLIRSSEVLYQEESANSDGEKTD